MTEERSSDVVRISKVGVFFPEFYYDLIARILPGAVLLAGCTLASGILAFGDALKSLTELSATAAILFCVPVFAGSYVSGILLTRLQWAIRSSYVPAVWKPFLRDCGDLIIGRQAQLGLHNYETKLQQAVPPKRGRSSRLRLKGRRAANKAIRELVWPLYGALHDFLKRENPQARFVLPKINGEAGLCENLAGGLALISLARVVRFCVVPGDSRHGLVLTVGLLWLFVGVCYSAAVSRYRVLVQRHFSYWRIQVRDK